MILFTYYNIIIIIILYSRIYVLYIIIVRGRLLVHIRYYFNSHTLIKRSFKLK